MTEIEHLLWGRLRTNLEELASLLAELRLDYAGMHTYKDGVFSTYLGLPGRGSLIGGFLQSPETTVAQARELQA